MTFGCFHCEDRGSELTRAVYLIPIKVAADSKQERRRPSLRLDFHGALNPPLCRVILVWQSGHWCDQYGPATNRGGKMKYGLRKRWRIVAFDCVGWSERLLYCRQHRMRSQRMGRPRVLRLPRVSSPADNSALRKSSKMPRTTIILRVRVAQEPLRKPP